LISSGPLAPSRFPGFRWIQRFAKSAASSDHPSGTSVRRI
jgi:hypothetical protein